MLVLGIDSSAVAASAAVAEDGRLLGEFYMNTKQTHSQTLLPMVQGLLQSLGKSPGDFHRFAVTHGPGSFTGVRIGVSCVKGMAFPHNTPCCGLSTLEAIAYGGLGQEGAVLCPVMDARCGQVYNALFQAQGGTLRRLTGDRALSIQQLGEECRPYGERLLLLGDGAALCHKAFAPWGARLAPQAQRYQRASSVALLACEETRPACSPAELVPVYLRLPQAERELKQRMEQKQGGISL